MPTKMRYERVMRCCSKQGQSNQTCAVAIGQRNLPSATFILSVRTRGLFHNSWVGLPLRDDVITSLNVCP